jgi:hypothetical protein
MRAPRNGSTAMDIVVDPALQAYIDPLTPEEHAALEASILLEGCRDALVLWGNVLVDGHNRYGICSKHGLPFQTIQNTRFQTMEDVHLWMIDQHLGRRSVSVFQRGVLALRRHEILVERQALAARAQGESTPVPASAQAPSDDTPFADSVPAREVPTPSRSEIAKAARITSIQAGMVEKIHKQAAPEVIAAVRDGSLSLNTAATLATLPQDEQRAAAQGGQQELKEAVKRVRDARRKPRPEATPDPDEEGAPTEVSVLRRKVGELLEENAQLRARVAELEAAVAVSA